MQALQKDLLMWVLIFLSLVLPMSGRTWDVGRGWRTLGNHLSIGEHHALKGKKSGVFERMYIILNSNV